MLYTIFMIANNNTLSFEQKLILLGFIGFLVGSMRAIYTLIYKDDPNGDRALKYYVQGSFILAGFGIAAIISAVFFR